MPHFFEVNPIPSFDALFLFDPSSFSPSACTPQKRRRCAHAKHPLPSHHKPSPNRPASSPSYNSRPQKRVGITPAKKSFTPNFDVIETSQAYILEGEFPGIKNKNDILIEFDDESRLVVKGDINTDCEKKTEVIALPAATEPEREGRKETKEQEEPTDNPKKRRSLSPTVEEVPDEEDDGYSMVRTPSTSSTSTMEIDDNTASSSNQETNTPETKELEKSDLLTVSDAVQEKLVETAEPPRKILLQERRQSAGSFSRTFKFASPVEIDGVKATLESGLLRIVVPKVIPKTRRIEVR